MSIKILCKVIKIAIHIWNAMEEWKKIRNSESATSPWKKYSMEEWTVINTKKFKRVIETCL